MIIELPTVRSGEYENGDGARKTALLYMPVLLYVCVERLSVSQEVAIR